MSTKKIGVVFSIVSVGLFLSLYGLTVFRSYFFSIPIELVNAYQIPCTSIEIGGNSYLVEIDLGSKTALSLSKEVLDKLKKDPCGVSRRVDFLGNKYETPLYFLSNVKVGRLLLKKIKAREESSSFTQHSTLVAAKECQNMGRIGRDFFSDKNLFMDFGHHVFVACNQLKDIKKAGYEVKEMTSIPFKTTANGITLEIETDMGSGKFVLDTGATGSCIRNAKKSHVDQQNGMPFVITSKFSIGGTEFGPTKLYLLDISPELDKIDGFLGMDFFTNHLVYLDFKKETIHIGKNH